MSSVQQTETVIIGAGFSGMCMAIGLQKAGRDDFVILEKAEEVGGTWRENHYPGAECDVASMLYSYSFEHNSAWEYKWSDRDQIFAYQKNVAKKYQLYPKIRFGAEVESATWNEDEKRWLVKAADGGSWSSRFLVAAVGQLHHPSIPDFPGLDAYRGPHFHSARWNHDVDMKDKKVAVIGNAASALQLIPEVAKEVAQLDVYQRSANWVLPKLDRPYKPWEQWLSEKLPVVNLFYRFKIWLRQDLLFFRVMRNNRFFSWVLSRAAKRHMEASIKAPELRRLLTPDYPIGAKRVLLSDNYYEALARENVSIISAGVSEFTPSGIQRGDGSHEAYDAVVFATGFKTNPFLAPMTIFGRQGQLLSEHWREGAYAYLGIGTSHFPNLFMIYGPNTNLGHNSIILMIEAQVKYIVACLGEMERRGCESVEVLETAESAYNAELQRKLHKMAFSDIAESWYIDHGKITNNWSGSTWEYMRTMRKPQWSAFNFT